MLTKLRQNYILCNIATKILFVLAFVFANWYSFFTATYLIDTSDPLIVFSAAVLLGLIVVTVLPFLINLFLNMAQLHSVPRGEYVLIATFFFAVNYILFGLLDLLRVFGPLVIFWGEPVFFVLSATVSMALFYHVTQKLYFNDVTRVYYFKVLMMVFAVLVLVGGYSL